VSTNIEKLLRIQENDLKVLQKVKEARDIPARKLSLSNRLSSHQAALEKAKDERLQTQARIKEYELEVDTKKALINKYKQQQYEIKDNEAYRALESEIRETQKRIDAIEDSELIFMEKLEERKADIDIKQTALDKEQALVEEEIAMLDERYRLLESEINEIKLHRGDDTSDIDPSWLKRYEQVFKQKGDVAIVNSVNGTCAGCHMKIPPQLVHDAKKAESMTSCNYCGRMLFFKI